MGLISRVSSRTYRKKPRNQSNNKKMFKKFDPKENKNNYTLMKSSVAKNHRKAAEEQYPVLESVINDIWPKKGAKQQIMKCEGKISIFIVNSIPLFYQQRDGPLIPTLRLLHKYPNMLPSQTCDKGAIKFILSGSNVMCPGLTHEKAILNTDLPKGTIVALHAEGKEHAMAIGEMVMSGLEIKEVNKGIGVNLIHYLNDGLWHMPEIS